MVYLPDQISVDNSLFEIFFRKIVEGCRKKVTFFQGKSAGKLSAGGGCTGKSKNRTKIRPG